MKWVKNKKKQKEMLSLVDINSFTAFSRVCNQINIPRDMEAEVMRYFIGLNKDEWYVLVFTYDNETINEMIKIYNRKLYDNDDAFYSMIIKEIMKDVYKNNEENCNDSRVKLYNEYIETQGEEEGIFHYHKLIKSLKIKEYLDDDDFPFTGTTYYFDSISLIRI